MLLMSLHIMAMSKVALQEFDHALDLYDEVLNIRLKHYPPEHALVTSVMRSIGMVHFPHAQIGSSQAIFEDIEQITEPTGTRRRIAFAMKQLGCVCSAKEFRFRTGLYHARFAKICSLPANRPSARKIT